MKILLSIFSINCVFASSYLNTSLIFKTNSYIKNLNSKLTSKQNNFSFLYPNNNKSNKLENNFLSGSKLSSLKTNYFNNVLLKSIAYNKSNLKLSSSLTNLLNYDQKHFVNKINTYLDKQDYLRMQKIKSKNNSESIIEDNLAFLNHFFNNNSIKFNPNGLIASRNQVLNANLNHKKIKNQSVFTFNQKILNQNSNFLNQLNSNKKKSNLNLDISWSGVYFNTGSKILTNYILHILNGSAYLTNAITKEFSKLNNHLSLKNTNSIRLKGPEELWDPQNEEQLIKYIFEDETLNQPNASEYGSFSADMFDAKDTQLLPKLNKFNSRVVETLEKYFEENPQAQDEDLSFWDYVEKATMRFGKDYLGYDPANNPIESSQPVRSYTWQELEKYTQSATNANSDISSDANSLVGEYFSNSGPAEIENELSEATSVEAAAEGIPIVRWVVMIVILVITITISVVVSQTLKKAKNWKINVGNLTPKGPWSLKQLRFNTKTRLFRILNSSQIQFSGQYFKPWFGKIVSKVNSFKPLHSIKQNKTKKRAPSVLLQKQYNLLTGTNKNFNLIVNPTTWKQMVAAANMPSSQFSVKQILAKNNVNKNNLYLSNQNWVDLIKQVKNPALNQNYVGDFKFKNSKLIYTNLTKNHQSNFRFQNSSYLKEMIVGDNNKQDLLLNKAQLGNMMNDLSYLKKTWNNSKAKTKNNKFEIKGIKNSIKFNPKGYQDFITWYYYYQLKPCIWIDSNSNDLTNIAFLKKIFNKSQLKQNKFSFAKSLNLFNTNAIIDLSSSQFN